MKEAELQQTITEALEWAGWRWIHFRSARTKNGWVTPMQGHVGFPDIIAVRDGKMLALELKGDGGRLRLGQKEWLVDLKEVEGCRSMLVYPPLLDEVLKIIQGKEDDDG